MRGLLKLYYKAQILIKQVWQFYRYLLVVVRLFIVCLYLTLNYMFQIQGITFGVKRLQPLDGWIPEYVTIEDVSARHMYKFRHDESEIDNTSVQLLALG